MSGYWAIGSVNTAIPPASVITIESTVAKMGRSMKKRENIVGYYLGVKGPSGREAGGTWPFEAGEVACEWEAVPLVLMVSSPGADAGPPDSAGAPAGLVFEPFVNAGDVEHGSDG